MSVHNAQHAPSYNSMPAPPAGKPVLVKKVSSGGGNKKGTSAERRATHNAVERARRESLNVRFLELAANLPATCTVRRPSKNLIVNKSMEFVRNALHNDAVLRLKLDDVMRQNQSLLQELNQMRAERGLSPRDNTFTVQQQQQLQQTRPYTSAGATTTGNDFETFSTDALAAAFGMPGLPQPLASAEFTKQVTEQTVPFDPSNVQWFSANGSSEMDDDYLSNNASADDFSAAASDHSSPAFNTDEVAAAAAAAAAAVSGHGFPSNNPLFQLQAVSNQPTNTYAANNAGTSPNSLATPAAHASPSYAHFLSDNVGITANRNTSGGALDFLPPITPNTAAVFSSLMHSTYNGNSNTSDSSHLSLSHPQQHSSVHGDHHHHHHAAAVRGSPGSLDGLPGYSHGHYFAMSA